MYDRYARSFLGALILSVVSATIASAQLMCAVDSNGDGDVDDVAETATCSHPTLCPLSALACTLTAPSYECPAPGAAKNTCTATGGFCEYPNPSDPVDTIAMACVPSAAPAVPTCPLGGGRPCVPDGAGGYSCSSSGCVDVSAAGGVLDESRPRAHVVDDGARDASGVCLDQMRIFSGFALDCRPPGAQTLFSNCCKNRGKIITDDGGGGLGAAGTITGFTAVFSGMSAAYSAFSAGASASAAAGAGASSIVSFFSPVSLAGAALIGLMVEFLNLGCDAQDMETGVLRGSGMCREIGEYCAVRLPLLGCIQKKRAHCCFNSKLARIIQEQGRPQLAAFVSQPSLWGEPTAPQCRGFTPEEFQALDFSAMDLSEYFDALALSSDTQMQSIVQDAVDEFTTTNSVN